VSRPVRVPAYRKHNPSGQAVVTITGLGGRPKDIYLGPHGSPGSHREYARVIAEWTGTVAGPIRPGDGPTDELSVNELVLKFWAHAQQYYTKNGKPSTELRHYGYAIKPLRLLYGLTPVGQFTPIALKALRQHFVSKNLSRSEVNRRVRLVRAVFQWGVGEGLLPAPVWQGLMAVKGIKRGRSDARETEPVRPVDDAMIDAVVSHLQPVVADMLRLQRLTGMRSGELCIMRPADVDRSASEWTYTPMTHKTEHHGRDRVIFFGPRAQAILAPYLTREPATFCFCPAEAEAQRNAGRSEKRVTPLWESHRRRNIQKRKSGRRRPPGSAYTPESYAKAIDRACVRAYPPPAPLARVAGETIAAREERIGADGLAEVRAWHKAHRFHPHQVRHRAAVEFRKRFGIEVCRALLGHSFAGMADHYAKAADSSLATQAAREAG
jgi:integrase